MKRPELPAQLREASFTLRQADAAGISRSRARASDLYPISRGLRIPLDAALTGGSAVRCYTDEPSSFLCGISAANLWGIPLPPHLQADWRLHLAHPRGRSQPRRANVVGHRLTVAPEHLVELDGVRLTSPARTWLDLAPSLTLDDLIIAADFLICRHDDRFPQPRSSLCSQRELLELVRKNPGKRGMRFAREAVRWCRVGADSPPETILRLILVRAGLPEPELNLALTDGSGRAVLWPDAAYPEQRVSIQYDGAHHDGDQQYRSDLRRAAETERLGWTEVRIGADDLTGPKPAAIGRVRRALALARKHS